MSAAETFVSYSDLALIRNSALTAKTNSTMDFFIRPGVALLLQLADTVMVTTVSPVFRVRLPIECSSPYDQCLGRILNSGLLTVSTWAHTLLFHCLHWIREIYLLVKFNTFSSMLQIGGEKRDRLWINIHINPFKHILWPIIRTLLLRRF